ncbi:hypothetical protein AQUCO_00100575v1 [Aquilegia coerulea]|uniref:Secreted protein n=1 Tax=Aquilegia coerulea TaxID=218851 RepID=A0A2G5FB35_AQUCA|nr:hypothetical protein AQUCO_00100575v1 [Aquilegia coerulea]
MRCASNFLFTILLDVLCIKLTLLTNCRLERLPSSGATIEKPFLFLCTDETPLLYQDVDVCQSCFLHYLFICLHMLSEKTR